MPHPLWIDSIKSVDGGRIKIEKHDTGVRVDTVDQVAWERPICVPHTTEGWSLPNYGNGTPTMDVGPYAKGGKPVLRQLIPFGHIATALQNDAGGIETNRRVLVQLEQVAFSSRDLWLPPKPMVVMIASLAEFLQEEFGIQQRYPYNPKDVKTGTWAVEGNPWRASGKFATMSAWHPHAAVPENEHWDCGAEDFQAILDMKPQDDMVPAFQLMATWKTKDDHRELKVISPHFAKEALIEDWMATDETNIRHKVWEHLAAGHSIRIAERQVERDEVRGAA